MTWTLTLPDADRKGNTFIASMINFLPTLFFRARLKNGFGSPNTIINEYAYSNWLDWRQTFLQTLQKQVARLQYNFLSEMRLTRLGGIAFSNLEQSIFVKSVQDRDLGTWNDSAWPETEEANFSILSVYIQKW
jgi:hypothetical protein